MGADAAALRAGLMGCLYVFAIYLGRQSTAYVSLCASGLAMTVANPLALWDIGFQLSFLATLGLILFSQPFAHRFEGPRSRAGYRKRPPRRAMGLLNEGLIVTLAAQVLTLPLIVYYFGRLSLISLVTNFLILPAQPPIMTGGMATLVAGLTVGAAGPRPGGDPLAVPHLHHRGRAADRDRAICFGGDGERGTASWRAFSMRRCWVGCCGVKYTAAGGRRCPPARAVIWAAADRGAGVV